MWCDGLGVVCKLSRKSQYKRRTIRTGVGLRSGNPHAQAGTASLCTSLCTLHNPLKSVTGYPPTRGSGLRGGLARIKERISEFVRTADWGSKI